MVPNVDGTIREQNRNQKPPKTSNTVCYRVSNKHKSRTILARNEIIVFRPRLYNSLHKYLRDMTSVKT